VTFVLGLNSFHADSSACLVKDGRLIAAAEEERFTRIKHWAGFPALAIRYCLEEAGIDLRAVQHVAVNQDPSAHLWRKMAYTVVNRPSLSLIFERLRNRKKRADVRAHLAAAFPDAVFEGEIHQVDHHAAHLASAYVVSPFTRAVVVSVDGFGDFASAAWGIGDGHNLRVDGKVFFPHSLGIFYEAMTQYLGFSHYGDEYKVMGLAPYGEPRFMAQMRRIVHLKADGRFQLGLRFFRHHNEKIDYEWENRSPTVGRLYSAQLEDLLGPARAETAELTQFHRDIARSTQAMYEEAFFHLLNRLHERYRLPDLVLSGGCAMNSVANGRVYRNTPFDRVYVQPAAGDAGGAIGAAFMTWRQLEGRTASPAPGPGSQEDGERRFVMDHAYWGPQFTNSDIRQALSEKRADLSEAECVVEEEPDEDRLCERTATAITEGKVIGWFQGRMEWGPRALGNRSILGDPRRSDMKELLNRKIKRRESFRPFAPSVLREHVAEWFETDDDVPFMMQVFQVREAKRGAIPAVTHVDGSGRLQTVTRAANPRFYKLIEKFQGMTQVPMLLNTSFNENEPIVCRPGEALDCFLRTRMDLLVIGDFLVCRRS